MTDIAEYKLSDDTKAAMTGYKNRLGISLKDTMKRVCSSAFDQPLTIPWSTEFKSSADIGDHRRPFHPKAIVPREYVIEEDDQSIDARIALVQKASDMKDVLQVQEFRKEVDCIHKRAQAEALKKAQATWLNHLEKQ